MHNQLPSVLQQSVKHYLGMPFWWHFFCLQYITQQTQHNICTHINVNNIILVQKFSQLIKKIKYKQFGSLLN